MYMVAKQTKKTEKSTQKSKPISHAVGRRKSSIARIWTRKGTGKVTVNGRDYSKYFITDFTRLKVFKPFTIIPLDSYDFDVNVQGGGLSAQADAISLGIARAMVELNPDHKPILREHGLLTVDDRVKERKKYGQRGARRGFQFVKR